MMRVCAIEDKTAVVVVASHRSVSRNPVRFKALVQSLYSRHVKLDLAKPETTEVFNPKCASHKASRHLF